MHEAPTGDPVVYGLASIVLIIASAFFVGNEYAVVSLRRSRLESLVRKGSKNAKSLLGVLDNLSPYIAGTQIGITIVGIATGAFTEPFVTGLLSKIFTRLPQWASQTISLILVLMVLVVLGELVPKYVALNYPERFALATFRPLLLFVKVCSPIIWVAEKTSQLVLRPFGINLDETGKESLPKEELLMLIQTGGADGVLEKTHADLVTRALRLDVLDAGDIMVHRLDIRWLDVSSNVEQVLQRLNRIRHTRIPVCRGDIDEIVGIAYLHDIVRHLNNKEFNLESFVRPMIAIPENLPIERIIQTMRENKTQILIVMDEYGGTSGLITLEDVVEEVFGELEDSLESERPNIEIYPGGRVSARSDVRFDELVARLNLPIEVEGNTDTLATIFVEALERVPKSGDTVETALGLMRIENMARRRITRVGIQLDSTLRNTTEEEN